MRISFRLILCSIVIYNVSCTTAGSPRTPAGQSSQFRGINVNLVQIARLEGENKALFMAEDTASNKFTVIEGSRPSDDSTELMVEGLTFAPLVGYWLPGTPESRQAFDQALLAAIDQENKILNGRWSLKDTVKNVTIGSFVSILSRKALITYRLRV